MTGTEDEDVVQYLIHPALRPALDAWLNARGLEAGRIPDTREDDLPTYVIGPRSYPSGGQIVRRPLDPDGANGICTTCGKPANPHPMRHPVTGDNTVVPGSTGRGGVGGSGESRAMFMAGLVAGGKVTVSSRDANANPTALTVTPTETPDVVREDRYTILVHGHRVRADDDTEARIRAMNAEQRAQFLTTLGLTP